MELPGMTIKDVLNDACATNAVFTIETKNHDHYNVYVWGTEDDGTTFNVGTEDALTGKVKTDEVTRIYRPDSGEIWEVN